MVDQQAVQHGGNEPAQAALALAAAMYRSKMVNHASTKDTLKGEGGEGTLSLDRFAAIMMEFVGVLAMSVGRRQ